MLPLLLLTTILLYSVNGDENIDLALAEAAMQDPDLFGGDMVVDMDEDRNVIPMPRLRWPGAIVPYVIDISLASEEALIKKAFAEYEKTTCIRFVPRTTQKNYIRIYSGRGCSSAVGMVGGSQSISLNVPGCMYVGSIIHELGHALGFYHEQNRSDRDAYLDIFLENVDEEKHHNFVKLKPHQNLLLTSFDYESIMIYDEYSFSNNGRPTMRTKTGVKLVHPARRQTLAQSDIQRLKKMYC